MDKTAGIQARVADVARKPSVRRTAIGLLALVVLFGLLGYFVLPGIVKSQLEGLVAEKLGRRLAIEAVEIHPFSLEASIRGLTLSERDGTTPFVSFDELYANLQAESLFRLAPVVREVRLSKPYLHLVREEAARFNFSDILALIASQPPSDEPARFSVNNISVDGGRIEFDDRPEKIVHTVKDLSIGIPFVSNLPAQVEVFVEPRLSAIVDGAALQIAGRARPFLDTRDAAIELDYEGLDLARFVTYLPFEPRFRLASAKLDLRLSASFEQARDAAPRLLVKGAIGLKALELTERDGKPLLALPQLDIALTQADVFANRVDIARVVLKAPQVDVMRRKDGVLNLTALVPPQSAAESAPSRAKPDKGGFALRIDEIALDAGVLRIADELPDKPFRAVIDRLDLTLRKFSLPGAEPAVVELALHGETGERLSHEGEFTLEPLAASGTVQLEALPLARYLPHYVPAFAGEVEKGELAARAKYAFSMDGNEPQMRVSEAGANLNGLALRLPGDKRSAVSVESIGIEQVAFDLAKRELAIGEIASQNARFAVMRGKDGTVNLARFAAQAAAAPAAPAPAEEPAQPFVVSVGRLALERWAARIEDQTMSPAVVTTVEPLSLQVAEFSTAGGNRAKVELKAQVNKKGQLAASGTVGATPLHANLKLDLRGVDLLPAQPYLTERVNVLLTSAALNARGTLAFDQAKDGTLKGGYRGDLGVNDLASVDKTNANDFLKWRSLFFGGVDAAFAPFALSIGEIALSDFYSRIILSADGRLNLQDIVRGPESASVSDGAAAPQKAAKPRAAPAPAQPMPPIRIAKLTLQGGQVNFTDNFIEPNYSANLMELGGSVTGLSSDAATSADVDLRGQVNNAPLGIVGKINPLKGDLSLDLKANVSGMELAPLSPYSGKYVGYGIEKGKLSFDVAYKLDQRKLVAQNRLVLDQLTFGDKIDSPSALKLPVQLAVALLRDRNGVIDLNVPIGGSLDDPQFSVGGVIVKVLVNIITKAVTSPFALLGSLFGGGEELSYVEFDAGRYAIAPAGEDKLKSLAKALADRPALKLEITGRADPSTDREGLRRAALERKVRALKLGDLVKKGESVDPDSVAVAPDEYPALLKRVYKDEKFPKPRNIIGLAKDLPVEEMEKLIVTNTQVSDDDVVALANQRAQAVKDWLLKKGGVAPERVFLLAARIGKKGEGGGKQAAEERPAAAASDETAKKQSSAKGSRVDFSLR